jgi:hypothetical protein
VKLEAATGAEGSRSNACTWRFKKKFSELCGNLRGVVFAVYFVCYLVFTPLDAEMVWGVQGRYFVPILSLVAIVVAALVDRAPGERHSAAMAISAAVLSGSASVEAILRTDWNL